MKKSSENIVVLISVLLCVSGNNSQTEPLRKEGEFGCCLLKGIEETPEALGKEPVLFETDFDKYCRILYDYRSLVDNCSELIVKSNTTSTPADYITRPLEEFKDIASQACKSTLPLPDDRDQQGLDPRDREPSFNYFLESIKSQISCLNNLFSQDKVCWNEYQSYLSNGKPFEMFKESKDDSYYKNLCCSHQTLYSCVANMKHLNSTPDSGQPCITGDIFDPVVTLLVRPVLLNNIAGTYCTEHFQGEEVCMDAQTDLPLVNPTPTPSKSNWVIPSLPLVMLATFILAL